MSGQGDEAQAIETLQREVADLRQLLGVVAAMVAVPPGEVLATKPISSDYRGGVQIVRPLNAPEIRDNVSRLLSDLGFDDLDFRVL